MRPASALRSRAPSRPRVRARRALALAWALGVAGCKADGAPFACQCDLLTDYDDAQKETVKVCARSAADAPSVARGCVQLVAPMPVQSCACAPTQGAQPTCHEGCLH